MHLNLTDPDSIVTWWRAFPERHWAYLDVFEDHSPQFRVAIRSARTRIQADPLFSHARIEAFNAAHRAAWGPVGEQAGAGSEAIDGPASDAMVH